MGAMVATVTVAMAMVAMAMVATAIGYGYPNPSAPNQYQQFYPGYGSYFPGSQYSQTGLGFSYSTVTNYGTSIGAPFGGSPPRIPEYFGYREEQLYPPYAPPRGGPGWGGFAGYGSSPYQNQPIAVPYTAPVTQPATTATTATTN